MNMESDNSIQLSDTEAQAFGYWSDLSVVQLDESSKQSWMMAMPYKTYQHPTYGKLEFTPSRAKNFADNIRNNVRGQDLDIDYDHKERTGEAAGWVKDAQVRPNGLFVLVEWTQKAFQLLKDGAYKYFSPEFVDVWQHPETGEKYQDVMFGGALTNRPFLKGILPINLSELTGDDTTSQEEPVREWLEKFAASLDVEFDKDTSDDALRDLVVAAVASDNGTEDSDEAPNPDAASETPAIEGELAQLAETNPKLAKALSENKAMQERIETLETAHRLSEISRRLSELDTDKAVLSPAAKTKVRSLAEKLPVALHDDLFFTISDIVKTGVVELGERGKGAANSGESSTEAPEAFSAEVRKLQEGEKDLPYLEAVERVAAQNPDLFAAYRKATTIGAN